MTTMKWERKPCPFCGYCGKDIFLIIQGERIFARCKLCYAQGPVSASDVSARMLWNHRAEDPK